MNTRNFSRFYKKWPLLAAFAFLSLMACDKKNACSECELVAETGPCKAAFPRYYYDAQEQQCKEFIWGGCEGLVPFETMAECVSCACN